MMCRTSSQFHSNIRSGAWRALHALVLLLLLLLLPSGGPAEAHHRRKSTSDAGLAFPNLSHGQLRIMARYKNDILALANRQVRPEAETRTLQNFVSLQFAYCLWGLVPGSLTNENHPFNGCTHAYLAASKALLHRLEGAAGDTSAARALATRINVETLQNNAAAEICANGAEPLNTADIIMPEWSGFTFNPIVLLYSLIAFLVTAALFALHFVRRPQRASAG